MENFAPPEGNEFEKAIVYHKSQMQSQDHGVNDIGVMWKGVWSLRLKRFKSYSED